MSGRASVRRELQSIRRSLASIARALGRLGPAIEAGGRGSEGRAQRRRTLKLSPSRLAGLKLQGQYMGYLRNLKPEKKARVKALRAAKGVRPAIRLAKSLAGRG